MGLPCSAPTAQSVLTALVRLKHDDFESAVATLTGSDRTRILIHNNNFFGTTLSDERAAVLRHHGITFVNVVDDPNALLVEKKPLGKIIVVASKDRERNKTLFEGQNLAEVGKIVASIDANRLGNRFVLAENKDQLQTLLKADPSVSHIVICHNGEDGILFPEGAVDVDDLENGPVVLSCNTYQSSDAFVSTDFLPLDMTVNSAHSAAGSNPGTTKDFLECISIELPVRNRKEREKDQEGNRGRYRRCCK